jgi:catechol 2,3-dioxygenase-like lactoylglutathione lyase family enzyme
MIHSLDCIRLASSPPDRALQDYATLLGRAPVGAALNVANTRLEIIEKPSFGSEGVAEMAFAVGDLAKARNLLERRAMRVHLEGTGAAQRLHLATDSTFGVPISLVERDANASREASPLTASEEGAVAGLDHVVVRTRNPERAMALYGARLGLSLRLDRTEPSWGARLLFFRCGDLIIELAHDLKGGISDDPDTLWGLSWRVPNVASAHTRVKAAGIDVSEIRIGRRPGTQIFTVRSHTGGVPTIMVGPAQH